MKSSPAEQGALDIYGLHAYKNVKNTENLVDTCNVMHTKCHVWLMCSQYLNLIYFTIKCLVCTLDWNICYMDLFWDHIIEKKKQITL